MMPPQHPIHAEVTAGPRSLLSQDSKASRRHLGRQHLTTCPRTTEPSQSPGAPGSRYLHHFASIHLHQLPQVLLQQIGVGTPLEEPQEIHWKQKRKSVPPAGMRPPYICTMWGCVCSLFGTEKSALLVKRHQLCTSLLSSKHA